MSSFTPYYRGFICIGGINIPVLPNATYSNPTNWSVPPIVGNLWQYDYGDGLRQPVLDCSFVVRNTFLEALNPVFWGYVLGRSQDNSFDTPYIGLGGGAPAPLGVIGTGPTGNGYGKLDVTDGVSFWDGATGIQMTGAKVASFSLSCTKGDDIRITVRFMGTGQQVLTRNGPSGTLQVGNGATTPAYVPPTNSYSVLRFNRLQFGNLATGTALGGTVGAFAPFPMGDGVRAGGAYSFSINYNNNLTPDLGLNGTVYPSGLNAGMQTCSVNYSIQALDTAVLDTYLGGGASQVGGGPQGLAVCITSPGTTPTRLAVFSLANLLDTSPDERAMSAPRVMRNHSLIVLGSDPIVNPPLAFIGGTTGAVEVAA